MNKTEIINAIKEIYELETIGTDFDINKLNIAVESYDYYVKPGIQRMMFMKAFGKILCKKVCFVKLILCLCGLLEEFEMLLRVSVCVVKKNPPIEGAGPCESAVRLTMAR